MYGVIIAAHGSRDSNAETIIFEIAKDVSGILKDTIVEIGFVKRSRCDFDEIFRKFDSQGINEIVVIPYFLFSGSLVTETLPKLVNEQQRKYPDKKITIKKPVGEDKRLAQIVAEQIVAEQIVAEQLS